MQTPKHQGLHGAPVTSAKTSPMCSSGQPGSDTSTRAVPPAEIAAAAGAGGALPLALICVLDRGVIWCRGNHMLSVRARICQQLAVPHICLAHAKSADTLTDSLHLPYSGHRRSTGSSCSVECSTTCSGVEPLPAAAASMAASAFQPMQQCHCRCRRCRQATQSAARPAPPARRN